MTKADELLRKLKNEVGGMLTLHEPELRRIMGNTNVAVMWERVRAADDYLVAAHPASPPHAAAEPEKPVAWMATNSRSKDMKWLFTDEASALDAADSMTGGTVTPLYAAVQQPIARLKSLLLEARGHLRGYKMSMLGRGRESLLKAIDNELDEPKSAEGEK